MWFLDAPSGQLVLYEVLRSGRAQESDIAWFVLNDEVRSTVRCGGPAQTELLTFQWEVALQGA